MNSASLNLPIEFHFKEPMTVISGRALTGTPPSLSITANGHPCISKVSKWNRLDRANRVYDFDFTSAIAVHSSEQGWVEIDVFNRAEKLHTSRWNIDEELPGKIIDANKHMSESRLWLLNRFRCPSCKCDQLPPVQSNGAIHCSNCSTVFPQTTAAMNLIAPDMRPHFSHQIPDQVSWHDYSNELVAAIAETRASGGKVLDVGAGFKTRYFENVIGLDLIDYPYVDLIASADNIPVKDDSFDLVFSLSVLEHVRDPFACGAEIERVLAPGGRLFCVVPFLFPVHAHPNHYYNMTFEGVRNLFSDRMETSGTRLGHPILALRQIVFMYFNGLPATGQAREDFAKMTINELMARSPADLQSSEISVALSEQAQNALAHGTHTWFRKRP